MKTPPLSVLGARLLIRPEEETIVSSLIIPDSVKKDERSSKVGSIVAVGSKVRELEIGTHVIFNEYDGEQIEYEGVSYFIVDEHLISATYA